MKESGINLWKEPNRGANNSSGFTALPGGIRSKTGYFLSMGTHGYYWSSTERNRDIARGKSLGYNSSTLNNVEYMKNFGLSVRCIRNENDENQ